MPPKRVECFEKLAETTECDIVCITPSNIHQFILPDHPLHEAYPYLSETHKADYLRCYLLHFYGGGYTDIKLQSGSWKQAFDDLEKSDAMVNGYVLEYGHHDPSCSDKWEQLIGTNAMICKPMTPFTQTWYSKILNILDDHLEELKKHPATYPQAAKWDGNGYPLEWALMTSGTLHKIVIDFSPFVLRTIPRPNLHLDTYRY